MCTARLRLTSEKPSLHGHNPGSLGRPCLVDYEQRRKQVDDTPYCESISSGRESGRACIGDDCSGKVNAAENSEFCVSI